MLKMTATENKNKLGVCRYW